VNLCARCQQPKDKMFTVYYRGIHYFCGTCSNWILRKWVDFMIANGVIPVPDEELEDTREDT